MKCFYKHSSNFWLKITSNFLGLLISPSEVKIPDFTNLLFGEPDLLYNPVSIMADFTSFCVSPSSSANLEIFFLSCLPPGIFY